MLVMDEKNLECVKQGGVDINYILKISNNKQSVASSNNVPVSSLV